MFVLTSQQSVANQFLLELREASLQRDRMRFRVNMERLGEILAYELSKTLEYTTREVKTPLGVLNMDIIEEQPALVTILRAGLPFFKGFLNFFDHADCGFIGAYRQEGKDLMTIKLEYVATNSLKGKTVIIIDPMLATGRSIMDAVNAIMRNGEPGHLHIASLVAAPEGIRHLKENLKIKFSLWTCAVDSKLNQQSYIVPGLGDAGDLSFGEKL